MVIGTVIYIAAPGRLPVRAARQRDRQDLDRRPAATPTTPLFTGPFAEVATLLSLGWLACDHQGRRDHQPRRHRPHLHDRLLAGGLRPVPQRLRPVDLRVDQQARRPVGGPDRGVHHRLHLLPAVPVAGSRWSGLITSASVLMYAGAPLSLGAFRKRLPDQERPFRLPAAEILSPLAFAISEPDHPVDHVGHRLEARRLDPDRLRDPDRQPAAAPQRAQADARLARRVLAAGLPARHGDHRLHQLVRADGRPAPAVRLGHAGDGRCSVSRSSTGRCRCPCARRRSRR